MKRNIKLIALGCVSVAAITGLLAAPHGNHGTDILHFFVTKTMTNEGVEPGATGRVEAAQNQQGHANNQRLNISAAGLVPGGVYELLARTGDDTNWVDVSQFTTDTNGAAGLQYRSHANSNGNGNNLPGALNPLSNIRALAIGSISSISNLIFTTNLVLTADLTDPDKLQYLIKRDLSTADVTAALRIKATTSQTQFRLTAADLVAGTDYYLVLNGAVVQTNTADGKGRLTIPSAPTPANILDLHSVAVWDLSSNVVVSTTLP
jgi:hypothetical protein